MANETNGEAKAPEVDLNNYVPKAEFDRLQTQASESSKGLESLKSQLLDADYLSYLESRKQQAAPTSNQPLKSINLKNIDMQELVALIEQHSYNVVARAVGPQLQQLQGKLTDVQAVLELENVRNRYEDFEDYQQEIAAVLERSPNEITIDQAYHIAKGINPKQQEAASTTDTRRGTSSERPGNVIPLSGDTIKTFKTSDEAAMAAANEVLARHGLSGDTI